jgi:energy-coupling factor transporter ATP-binding protein EcfA2
LLAFQEKDAEFFFGRERFVDALVRVVQQQPLVAVIGSSGSGKSSVTLAGLIPKLREAGSWLIESFRPNKQPFYELAAALISQLEPELGKTDKTIKAKELAESIRQHGFTADVSAILKDKPGKRLLLVVDQFEELYTGCADTEQQQFVEALLAAVESASRALTLVLTLRADFYSYVVNYPPFAEALNNYPAKNITLMKAEEMQKAIELPAEKKGVKLEEGLTQRILDGVKREPGNLPLLEFALTQLWEKQSRGLLTHQAYSEIGGVARALSNHAEVVYGKLSEQEQKQAQQIFLQLVRPGEGTEDTRRVATRGEVGNWELVTFLAGEDARLVVTGRDEQTDEKTVEVVHEALIREWRRLRGWIDENRTFRTWQEQLRRTNHKTG